MHLTSFDHVFLQCIQNLDVTQEGSLLEIVTSNRANAHRPIQQTLKFLQEFTHTGFALKVVEVIVYPQQNHSCDLWSPKKKKKKPTLNKTFHCISDKAT